MPNLFERYRMYDGRTPLSEQYFNPILQDIDLRLATLEAMQSKVDVVISELLQYGLARIDTAIVPIIDEINEDLIVKQAAITAYVTGLNNATIAGSLTINGTLTANKATNQTAGLVKTNSTNINPIVYLKSEIDSFITSLTERTAALETAATNSAAAITALVDRMTAAEGAIVDQNAVFISGKNFGSWGLTVEGRELQTHSTAGRVNTSVSTGLVFSGTEGSTAFVPPLSEVCQTLFSTNYFPSTATADFLIDFPNLTAGKYQVYLWIFQPAASTPKQSFNIFAQNSLQFAFNINSLPNGRNWTRIKVPCTMSSTGSLTIKLTPTAGAPAVRIAAVELFREI